MDAADLLDWVRIIVHCSRSFEEGFSRGLFASEDYQRCKSAAEMDLVLFLC